MTAPCIGMVKPTDGEQEQVHQDWLDINVQGVVESKGISQVNFLLEVKIPLMAEK